VGAYSHSLYDKKELDVYLRVPGSSEQNTGLDITLSTLPWKNCEQHFLYFSLFFHGSVLAKTQPLPLVNS